MRRIDYIVVHCSATNQKVTAQNIMKSHMMDKTQGGRGWSAPGYHYVVEANGSIVYIWEENRIANGVKGNNLHSIHVCYVGGIDKNSKPIDNRTDEQKKSLIKLLKELRAKYPNAKIKGHRDFSKDLNNNGIIDPWERIKACPCFDAIEEYKDI